MTTDTKRRHPMIRALPAPLTIPWGVAVLVVGATLFGWSLLDATYLDAVSYRAALFRDGIYAPFQLVGPYSLGDVSHGRGFLYPPTSLPLLAPLALGTWTFPVFAIGSVAAMVGAVLLVLRHEGALTPTRGMVAAGVTLAIFPTADAAQSGQVSPLIAASLGVAWVAPRWSGWLGVLGGAVKLFPAALLFWAIRSKAPVGWPLLAGIGMGLATLPLFGVQAWWDFLAVTRNAEPTCNIMAGLSVGCLTGIPWLGYLLTVLLIIGAVRVRRPDVGFALLSLAMIAPAPDLWPHYWLIPLVGFLPFAVRVSTRAVSVTSPQTPPLPS